MDQGRGAGSVSASLIWGEVFPVDGSEVIDGMADVGCEIAVFWEMSRVNSRVISGLFGGLVNCFIARNAAVSRDHDKDYVEVGGSANEV